MWNEATILSLWDTAKNKEIVHTSASQMELELILLPADFWQCLETPFIVKPKVRMCLMVSRG